MPCQIRRIAWNWVVIVSPFCVVLLSRPPMVFCLLPSVCVCVCVLRLACVLSFLHFFFLFLFYPLASSVIFKDSRVAAAAHWKASVVFVCGCVCVWLCGLCMCVHKCLSECVCSMFVCMFARAYVPVCAC